PRGRTSCPGTEKTCEGKTGGPREKFLPGPGNVKTSCSVGRSADTSTARRQTALPATHAPHPMFQPMRPLSGATVLSGEFFTPTTSPTRELSKNHLPGVLPPAPRTSASPTQP